jgi:hypothetical protein
VRVEVIPSRKNGRGVRSLGRTRGFAVVIAALALVSLNLVGLASMQVAGDSRTDPIPLTQEGQLGPWKFTVLEVVSGEAATQQVMAASPQNAAPADGFSYLVVKVRATNTAQRAYDISPDDFAATGASGNVRRFPGVEIPAPALDGSVEPGASLDGYVVLGQANDEQNLLMTYDSLSISGDWADGVLALQEGATVGDVADPAVQPNDAGKDPGAPAALDQQIVTADWAIQVVDVQSGEAVWNLYPSSDYRTTALGGPDVAAQWLAFKVSITNVHTGGTSAFLSPSAFMLADEEGNPITDVLTLTPPSPDASGEYFPAATREGWVVFEVPETYSGSTVRFLPNLTDSDPRYLDWNGSAPSNEAQPEVTHVALTDLQVGDHVLTNEQGVNLRESASTDAEIVETYPQGTALTVTGGAKEADGHTWYPAKNPETGDKGWVASEFVDRAE